MTVEEKQFELGGVTFGLGCDVELTADGWQPGSTSMRSNDVDVAGASGRRFGRSIPGGATWGFSLYTDQDSEEEAWRALSDLKAAWESLADPTGIVESESVTFLRYQIAGKTRRVYGQPRRFDKVVSNLSLSGRIDLEADFELAFPLYLDDTEHSQTFGILAPPDPTAGVIVPVIVPFTSSSGTGERVGSIKIGGEVPTPVIVEFIAGTGNLFDAQVTVGTGVVALRDTVFTTEKVIADPRPWVRSVSTASGGAVAVDARVTRLAKMWLPPGEHRVVFTGEDATSSASAVIRWHDAYRSER